MTTDRTTIEKQILAALGHVEAEDGLYFNNLIVVHEEEERPIVVGDEEEVRSALDGLVRRHKVMVSGEGDQKIYRLSA